METSSHPNQKPKNSGIDSSENSNGKDNQVNEENKPDTENSIYFEQVLHKELEYFKNKDKNKVRFDLRGLDNVGANKDKYSKNYHAKVVEAASKAQLTGLAFSGGGIRSATFNLGVLQALAKLKLLGQFDYLSTVSGGGYIGCWFTAWTRREDIKINEEKEKEKEQESCNRKATKGIDEVVCELASSISTDKCGNLRAAMQPDPQPIWHLREYSNYLSPRRGLWSEDTWTLGITYIRNLLLTFSLLLLTLIALVLFNRAFASFFFKTAYAFHYPEYEIMYQLVPVFFCISIFFSSLAVGYELFGHRCSNKRLNFSYVAVGCTLFTSIVGTLWLWQTITQLEELLNNLEMISYLESLKSLDYFIVAIVLTLIPIIILCPLGLLVSYCLIKKKVKSENNCDSLLEKNDGSVPSVIAGVALGLFVLAVLLSLLGYWMTESWCPTNCSGLSTSTELIDPKHWLIVVWGIPMFVLSFFIAALIFVGSASDGLRELDREWLGRFFAVLFRWIALITFLMVLVVYSHSGVMLLDKLFKTYANMDDAVWSMGLAWGMLSATGAFLARNMMIEKSTNLGWLKKLILAIAPIVFIVGMLILTVWLTNLMVIYSFTLVIELDKTFKMWAFLGVLCVSSCALGAWGFKIAISKVQNKGFRFLLFLLIFILSMLLIYWLFLGFPPELVNPVFVKDEIWPLVGMLQATVILMFLWSWRVGVNLFSLHSMYADRLIRAYLGASNPKRHQHVDSFTGFAYDDNSVNLSQLAEDKNSHSGPYPIINAAINLVSSQRLAWQQRKAASFTFTPMYCGYEIFGEECVETDDSHTGGFVKSDLYAGNVSLGKAMTISGAAASPNMGYQTSPALAFLMTTFNVRLGWWLPNTENKIKNSDRLYKRDPPLGFLYLLKELISNTNANSDYVYLSDGGHFENLGIYELVRRQCQYIIASDSEADPSMTFSGLGNAIEKCRTDLGVPIEIDISQIKPDSSTGRSQWHCAIGCIRYSEVDPGQADGTLVYIKASLTGDEPLDVTTYANNHSSFPHQTTADQWFNESQFESYRTLGEHSVKKVLETAVNAASAVDDNNERKIGRVIREARKHWYPDSSANTYKLSDHDALLESILDTLRTDTHLSFLDGQLYPNLKKVADAYSHKSHFSKYQFTAPRNYEEFRAGFYFCKRLIQFTQQVYYDRQLDLEYGTPRNRGWMNLFHRWSWSRMLKFTWTMTAGTYGARFQSFCEYHLSLESGEPEFDKNPLKITATLSKDSKDSNVEPGFQFAIEEKAIRNWKDAEKQLDLHYYEMCIIKEFIVTYVQNTVFEYITQKIIFDFEVYPLKVATDNAIDDQADNDMKLNAGFLITGPAIVEKKDKDKDKNKKKKSYCFPTSILYFRIRPSMRNMDLARKVLSNCKKHEILKNYSKKFVDTRSEEYKDVWKKVNDAKKKDNLKKSAWQRAAFREIQNMDRKDINHCRWLSQLENMEEAENEKNNDEN